MSTEPSPAPGHYYVPSQSRLPVMMAAALGTSLVGAALTVNELSGKVDAGGVGGFVLLSGLAGIVLVMFLWFRVVVLEDLRGYNNEQMDRSYVLGMSWFIFSEVMFFFGFFFALAYVRNFAVPWMGGEADILGGIKAATHAQLWQGFQAEWPVMQTPQAAVGGLSGQYPANTGDFSGPGQHMAFPGWAGALAWLPLWNTLVLLSSSVTVHIAHLGLKNGNRTQLTLWLAITVALGAGFLVLQYTEYVHAISQYGLSLRSGIYGSTFFMLTGFHGFHVMMGTVILLVMWLRTATRGHFTPESHFGFEAAAWYWHFVDVVWLCLFLFVYIM